VRNLSPAPVPLAIPSGEPNRPERKQRKSSRTAWVLIAPFLIFYVLFLIYPALRVVFLSLTNSDIAGQGRLIGLANYQELIFDQEFWAAVWHTVYFVLLTVVPNTAIGFLLALLVLRLKRLRLPILSAFFLPNVLPVSVVTNTALWILDANFGIVNNLLGTNTAWFGDSVLAMPCVAIVTIWWTVGFNMLLFLAGLQNIPGEYYEAAALDGANGFQRFLFVTCPLIWPVTSLVLVLQLILQFKIFDQVYLLTNGGPSNSTTVVLLYMYREAFNQNRGGYASAVAMALVVIIVAASLVQSRVLRLRPRS
jgi:multiple sugar transport system permease protein